ncbi:hypothetical protein GCM10011409_38500 [Lentibacillus populi]|uniref:Uncharacterized protein n=1 Tax=Lentibacillus populi TaxID=1827502 RepID=A0A9W5U0S9_9BACI|nr:hypothetical protein [Lentibacillus populi]GGB57292.1 hypothetical protein GCM10011409_38500 [Lentibacillus populi]
MVQKDIQKDYPFILCVAVRLARYNVKEFDGAFYGIPITAAGIVMILSSLLVPYLPVILFAVLTSLLMVLMVSNIRITKFFICNLFHSHQRSIITGNRFLYC